MSKEPMDSGYNTKARRLAIKRLITTNRIETQTDLANILEKEGFRATQATVSRDIRELHLIKVNDKQGKYYSFPETNDEIIATDQFKNMYRNLALKSDRASNLIVIHTAPGMAQALCALMDRMDWSDIIGSLAGDDTVLLIAQEEASALRIMEVLSGL